MTIEPSLFDTPQSAPDPDDGMPPWLIRRLENNGYLDPASGVGRRAQARRCPVCHHPILIGADSDMAALTATCNPHPLTPLGEALARLAGRPTFDLRYLEGRLQLDYRDRSRIQAHPAAAPRSRADVLVEHQHSERLPAPWCADSVLPDPFTPTTAPDIPAPF